MRQPRCDRFGMVENNHKTPKLLWGYKIHHPFFMNGEKKKMKIGVEQRPSEN